MTDQDVVHESALSDFRYGLLNHGDVIDRFLRLSDLREQWVTSRSPFDGRDYWALIGLTELQLDRHFSQADLDHFASVIRERLELGLWGKLVPVARSGGYGRQRKRVQTVPESTVKGAVEAVARQLNPDRRYPIARSALAGTRRQWRRRLRQLASS